MFRVFRVQESVRICRQPGSGCRFLVCGIALYFRKGEESMISAQHNETGECSQLDVVLLSPPYDFPPRPSIALSLFRQCLNEAGMRSRVFYPMFRLSHLLGIEACRKIEIYPYTTGLEEYIFAHMTDAENNCRDEDFARFLYRGNQAYPYEEVLALIKYAREKARQCVEEVAQEIAQIRPGVLAVSSIFSQINGALAVIKRVKELAPDIVTILGGTNVQGEAGAAVLRHYPSVDYVFFGEGDEVFARVCRIAMGAERGPMPYGVIRHGEEIPDPIPHRMTEDMNKVCYPDYSDYIADWDREQAGEFGPPMFGKAYVEEGKHLFYLSGANYALYLEGSRGCWWGQHHPCSFCGLNGRKNVYRYKSAQHLCDEILEMSRRYDNNLIQLTDNILSFDAMEHLLPMLAESGKQLNLVGEVKTNLKEQDIEQLVKAGFCLVQPGIESLNDHLLQLMNKGNNAASHVAFLKYCRKHDLSLSWNLLIAFPGEKKEDYEEMISLIPKIVHFQPPMNTFPILFQRYSRYLEDPEQFGLELAPNEMYRYIYGDSDDRIENMCMYYQLTGGAFKEAQEQMQPWYDRLYAAVYEWKKIAYSGEKRSLVMAETAGGLLLLDSRPCMVQPFSLLTGVDRLVFLTCGEVKTEKQLLTALRGAAPEEEILAAAEKLTALNFLAKLGGHYISLALPAH